MFRFDIIHEDSRSRARFGRIHTPHGTIDTPAFIFCATKADIKGVTIDHIKSANTQIILSNTYHLMLQPGSELISRAGGLHKFLGWNGPMFTDSGGFQIFSLGHGGVASEIKGAKLSKPRKTMLKVSEGGAHFRSYVDGRHIYLTPELSMKVQRELGADLIVCFDECTPYHVNRLYTANSMEKSKRWASRCLEDFRIHDDGRQALLAVIQGGVYRDLREESARFANENDFFAFAIGGSLGKTVDQMYDVVNMTSEMLDRGRYIHLLGIGGIEDIFNGVRAGIDTFDCVSPTRIARHGTAILKAREIAKYQDRKPSLKNHMNLINTIYKDDHTPISEECDCYVCRNFSKAYIHHLFKAKEHLGGTLVSIHNIHMMNRLMYEIRQGIMNNDIDSVYKDWVVV